MATLKTRKRDAVKGREPKAIDRPFAAQILSRAKELVAKYQIVVRFDDEEGEYFGRGLELPNAIGDGATPDACVANTREAMQVLVAFMIERGERVPSPASDAGRNEQINIRLTTSERLLLEEASGQRGFRGISDFVRAAALHAVERDAGDASP